MRLTSIKLAGFKSFVDPTKVEFRSQLTAIVGPNGCGKSNIIDAVRWVMGESSAKQLRGESLVDVIFNGSTHRAPISQASIELHFDNSDGQLSGEYAAYSDITVRRQVSRDGQSYYSLNGSRCRRKDITDLFLGTGLGPRSYAIIEQGTISRLVEAKPDELRIFLEEAAGISKYKERRKETEVRLTHTKDNLARLHDIGEELSKQIQHLDRQAKSAERFKTLKSEERRVKAELLWVKSQTLQNAWLQKRQDIDQEHDRFVGLQSQLAVLEAGVHERLERQQQAQSELTLIQQQYMEQGAQVARLEQSINHHQQRHVQIQEDLRQLSLQTEQQSQLKQRDEQRLQALMQEEQDIQPKLNEQQQALIIASEALDEIEQQASRCQSTWDRISHALVAASQLAQQKQHELQQVEHKHQHLLQQQQSWQQDQLRFQDDLASLMLQMDEPEAMVLQEQLQQAEETLADSQQRIQTQRQHLSHTRGLLQQSQQRLNAEQAELTALDTYQKQALAKTPSSKIPAALEEAKPLLEYLHVEAGFEAAVESVLNHWLKALCVDSVDASQIVLANPHSVLDLSKTPIVPTLVACPFGDALANKVQGPAAIMPLFANVYVCELSDLQHYYAELTQPITLVSREGVVLKPGLLQQTTTDLAPQGMLERQKQMQQLGFRIDHSLEQCQQQQEEIRLNETQLAEYEQAHQQLQQHWQQLSRQVHQQQSQLQIRLAKQQQLQDRLQGTQQQLTQAVLDLAALDQKHHTLRDTWQEALTALNSLNAERDDALEQRNSQQQQLQHSRSQHQTLQQRLHQLTLQQQRLQSEQSALRQQVQRIEEQLQHYQQRQRQRQQLAVEVLEPIEEWQITLEHTLTQRFQQEHVLQDAKIQVHALIEGFRQIEQQKRDLEQQLERQRSALDNLRLNAESLHSRFLSLEEQRQSEDIAQQDIQGVELDETALQQQLDDLAQKIQRLGLVNLTAIEEFETQSARKLYLDQQQQDLSDAIQTLENAMRTIDRETKTRFQETFDQVNHNFQTLFPTVFAGGKAYLELTGDDLLNTGVAIFAQPVGKRNSTIHLLSGGEKALTAVALVFAIFQINPAPFCMLDEVDAPLDDSNVARFCQLVKVMTDKTQFIMVTHNKVAMEMAHQLMGVTMQEPGVSRLVAVDMNDAMAMIGE